MCVCGGGGKGGRRQPHERDNSLRGSREPNCNSTGRDGPMAVARLLPRRRGSAGACSRGKEGPLCTRMSATAAVRLPSASSTNVHIMSVATGSKGCATAQDLRHGPSPNGLFPEVWRNRGLRQGPGLGGEGGLRKSGDPRRLRDSTAYNKRKIFRTRPPRRISCESEGCTLVCSSSLRPAGALWRAGEGRAGGVTSGWAGRRRPQSQVPCTVPGTEYRLQTPYG